jgi:hypothetical protein
MAALLLLLKTSALRYLGALLGAFPAFLASTTGRWLLLALGLLAATWGVFQYGKRTGSEAVEMEIKDAQEYAEKVARKVDKDLERLDAGDVDDVLRRYTEPRVPTIRADPTPAKRPHSSCGGKSGRVGGKDERDERASRKANC